MISPSDNDELSNYRGIRHGCGSTLNSSRILDPIGHESSGYSSVWFLTGIPGILPWDVQYPGRPSFFGQWEVVFDGVSEILCNNGRCFELQIWFSPISA